MGKDPTKIPAARAFPKTGAANFCTAIQKFFTENLRGSGTSGFNEYNAKPHRNRNLLAYGSQHQPGKGQMLRDQDGSIHHASATDEFSLS